VSQVGVGGCFGGCSEGCVGGGEGAEGLDNCKFARPGSAL